MNSFPFSCLAKRELFLVVDTHTKKTVTTYHRVEPARKRRDKLDAKYGAARYIVRRVELD